VWARSRIFLGPIFVATATATGAATTRLTLAADGQPEDDPSHVALAHVEAGAILAELILSTVNERRLGRAGEATSHGAPAVVFRAAKALVTAGLVLPPVARQRGAGRSAQNVASILYLAGGLAFRVAWYRLAGPRPAMTRRPRERPGGRSRPTSGCAAAMSSG
jgi:hypothetical protein